MAGECREIGARRGGFRTRRPCGAGAEWLRREKESPTVAAPAGPRSIRRDWKKQTSNSEKKLTCPRMTGTSSVRAHANAKSTGGKLRPPPRPTMPRASTDARPPVSGSDILSRPVESELDAARVRQHADGGPRVEQGRRRSRFVSSPSVSREHRSEARGAQPALTLDERELLPAAVIRPERSSVRRNSSSFAAASNRVEWRPHRVARPPTTSDGPSASTSSCASIG